uniref:Uncharacterized protein n=1 Tax=Cacopsylla melanoneura TaxID=428564 RepID=A0A8D9B1I3_9HEMI
MVFFCLQLKSDFKLQYPMKEDNFFIKINSKSEDIIRFARSKAAQASKHSGAAEGIRTCLDLLDKSATDIDTEISHLNQVTALMLLPYLVALPGNGRGKSVKKVSRTEVVESFINSVGSDSDIDTQVQQRRKKGERIQPHIVYSGNSPFTPSKVFVVFDDVKYLQPDIVSAVDATFKIIMALNALYPEPSKDVWLLIQIGLFEIKTVFDPKSLNQTVRTILIACSMYPDS